MAAPAPKPGSLSLMTRQDYGEEDHTHDKMPRVKMTIPNISKNGTIQQPVWLRKYAMIMFFLLFVACAASLVTLDRFIASRNGLPLSISSNEYSWTYGPTAVLVVVLSLWRRIDYYYKSSQPWHELCSGPAPTERTLLLDYVSSSQLKSMFQARRFGHYPVAMTILSFFLLKGIILISTTLFVVQPSLHPQNFDIEYRDALNAALAWKSPPYNLHLSSPSPQMLMFTGGSDQSIWRYLAKLNNPTTNDTEWNTQDGLVTQRFSLPPSTLNVTSLEAPVDVFAPQVSCEDAAISVYTDRPYSNWAEYDWNTSTCSVAGLRAYYCPAQKVSSSALNASVCGNETWTYTLHRVNCSADTNETSQTTGIEPYDVRYLVTAAKFDIKMKASNRYLPYPVSTKLINSTSTVCKIVYSIVSSNASYDLLSGSVSFPQRTLDEKGRLLPNLTSNSLSEMLWTNLDASANALITDKNIPTTKEDNNLLAWRADEAFFQLMAAKLGHPADLGIFLQPSILKNTSTIVLEGLLTEFARESLLVKTGTDGTAAGLISQARLHTRHVAVWLMVAGFVVLAIICLLLMFRVPSRFWIPAMCGSLAGHAAIIINSQPLQALLRDTGHYSDKELKNKLDGMQFAAGTNSTGAGDFCIEILEGSHTPKTPCHAEGRKKEGWLPMSGRLYFVIIMLIAAILAIGVLELLHQLSSRRHGLLDMHRTDSTVLSYLIRIASTMVVFAIATMFNSLDFTLTTFAPYSSLRLGSARADRSILLHLLSVSPFQVGYRSLRLGHFGIAASNISSLIGSFLTVIVSGLWILNGPIVMEQPSPAAIVNWASSWSNNALDDAGAAMTLNLVRHGGANTSAGIWQDVVLPEVSLASSHADRVYAAPNYTYSLGALRPLLNCTILPQENLNSNLTSTQVPTGAIMQQVTVSENNVSAHFLAPAECIDSNSNGTVNISFSTVVENIMNTKLPLWIGKYSDLNTTAGDVRTACPSVGILFGRVAGNDTSNLTALVCSQGIEQVALTVTYEGNPTLGQISKQQPPQSSPGRAWRWHNDTSNAQTFGYRLQRFLDTGLAPFQVNETEERYDPFFNHLLLGPNNQTRESLAGPENVGRLFRAVSRDYSEYMRNVINLNFRAKKKSIRGTLVSATGEASLSSYTNPSSASTGIIGTTSEEVIRLGIHATSKLILQILLAVMVVFGLASYFLVKLDGTLPRNPCTIASTMAFLAGSQMCDRDSGVIPQGAEYMSNRRLKKVFDGWVFSLGWWHAERSSVEGSDGTTEQSVPFDGRVAGSTVSAVETASEHFGIDVGRANVSDIKVNRVYSFFLSQSKDH